MSRIVGGKHFSWKAQNYTGDDSLARHTKAQRNAKNALSARFIDGLVVTMVLRRKQGDAKRLLSGGLCVFCAAAVTLIP